VTTQDFLDRLERVKKSGDGWSARCPAHDDRKPSLSITAGEGDVPVFHCHAGCEQDDVVASLGLTWPEVLGDQAESGNGAVITNTYPYVDEEGKLLFEAVRYVPKDFRQRRPDGSGGWIWNLRGVRRVLYRLPAVMAAVEAGQPIFVVEGEKDVHALEQLGLTATTNPMGAGKWRPEYGEALRGARHVYVVPDDDSGGRAHAAVVASSLVGVVEDVRIVELWPRGESHSDVAEWLAVDGQEPEQARTLLGEIVARSPAFTGDRADPDPVETLADLTIVPFDRFVEDEEEGASALVGDDENALITEDGDITFYGDGGAGKTSLAVDLGCHLAAGDPWIGLPITRPARVLFVENEGPRPRFRKKLRRKRDGWKGSDLGDRLHVLETPWARITFADEAHRQALAAKIAELEIDVLIAGPVTNIGMNEAGTLQEVRDFLRLVADLRGLSGRALTVILIHHENKAGSISGAWEPAGDTLLHVMGQGHGRTRVFIQKARWASDHHAKTLNLIWTEGEGFEREETTELDDNTIADMLIDFVRKNAGATWSKVEGGTKGVGRDRRMAVRDRLFAGGMLVNIVRDEGADVALAYCPERRPSRLYVSVDPSISHLLPARGADGEQIAPARGAGDQVHLLPAPRLKEEQGVGAPDSHPHEHDLFDEWEP
jgi:hypothetical protein